MCSGCNVIYVSPCRGQRSARCEEDEEEVTHETELLWTGLDQQIQLKLDPGIHRETAGGTWAQERVHFSALIWFLAAGVSNDSPPFWFRLKCLHNYPTDGDQIFASGWILPTLVILWRVTELGSHSFFKHLFCILRVTMRIKLNFFSPSDDVRARIHHGSWLDCYVI